MMRLRPAARWGALLLAAGASLATSPDESAPILSELVDAPAFDLDADHPTRAFVVMAAPNDAALGAGIRGGGLTLFLTLRGVGPDGPAAALRISFEQARRVDDPTPSMDGVGVAPGETRELSVSFDLFEECDAEVEAEVTCPEEVVVGFEHLGGADVEVTWKVSAQAYVGGSDDPPKGAAIAIDVGETSDIPD